MAFAGSAFSTASLSICIISDPGEEEFTLVDFVENICNFVLLAQSFTLYLLQKMDVR